MPKRFCVGNPVANFPLADAIHAALDGAAISAGFASWTDLPESGLEVFTLRDKLRFHTQRNIKMVRILAAALICSGCATSTPINTGGAQQSFLIECDGSAIPLSVCVKKANEVCPTGYDILDRRRESASVFGTYVSQNITVKWK